MKEVPKKDEPEVSGGVQQPNPFIGGLVIPSPGLPMPQPGFPTTPCIPMPLDPTRPLDK